MKTKVDHVLRPRLPWRTVDYTECGLPTEGHPVITRDEFVERVKELGKQRASLFTCMACWSTAAKWSTSFDEDPTRAVYREFYGTRQPDLRFADELRAIAALVDAHRDEFDAFMEGLTETASLADRRRARRAAGHG